MNNKKAVECGKKFKKLCKGYGFKIEIGPYEGDFEGHKCIALEINLNHEIFSIDTGFLMLKELAKSCISDKTPLVLDPPRNTGSKMVTSIVFKIDWQSKLSN